MKYQLNPHIYIFGKAIRTPKISITFLSYLLLGKQNILIDTVPYKAAEAYMKDLESVLPLTKLDGIILNHSEEDHSGALGAVLEKAGDVPIYCTEAAKDRIGDRYPGADFRPVADGSSLTLGDYTFRFIHTPGLHWPDNMVTWLESEGMLFSNDLFGQYLAEDPPVEGSLSDEDILAGSRSYFEKVFRSSTHEERSVILDITDLPIRTLAPGHGLVLQKRWPALRDYYREEAVKE